MPKCPKCEHTFQTPAAKAADERRRKDPARQEYVRQRQRGIYAGVRGKAPTETSRAYLLGWNSGAASAGRPTVVEVPEA